MRVGLAQTAARYHLGSHTAVRRVLRELVEARRNDVGDTIYAEEVVDGRSRGTGDPINLARDDKRIGFRFPRLSMPRDAATVL